MLFGGGQVLEDLRPYFDLYAENIFHIGPPGHASASADPQLHRLRQCRGLVRLRSRPDGLDLPQAIRSSAAGGRRHARSPRTGPLAGDFRRMSLANARRTSAITRWLEEQGCRASWPKPCTDLPAGGAVSGTTAGPAPPSSGLEAVTGVEARVAATGGRATSFAASAGALDGGRGGGPRRPRARPARGFARGLAGGCGPRANSISIRSASTTERWRTVVRPMAPKRHSAMEDAAVTRGDGEMHQADRLARRGAAGAGDAGDRHREINVGLLQRADRHLESRSPC